MDHLQGLVKTAQLEQKRSGVNFSIIRKGSSNAHVSCLISGMMTNHEISPGMDLKCEQRFHGFTVTWLFGQFRWSSGNKLALFSDLSEYHLLGALLEPSLPSHVEREETFNTPLWPEQLAWYMAHT